MLRQRINGLLAAIALVGGVIVSSGVAWSNIAGPADGRAYTTRADFDQAFADAAAASRPGNTPTHREKLCAIGWKHLNGPLAGK